MKKKIIIIAVALALIAGTVAMAFALTVSRDDMIVNLAAGDKSKITIVKDPNFKMSSNAFVPAGGKVVAADTESIKTIAKFKLDLNVYDKASLTYTVAVKNKDIDLKTLVGIEIYEGNYSEGATYVNPAELKADTDYSLVAKWLVGRDSDLLSPELVNQTIVVDITINAIA